MPNSITFLPVTQDHRELLRGWLDTPHVREWWGETEKELALIYDGMGEHEPYLAGVDGLPIAYIQAWWPIQHPHLEWLRGMTASTRGIDLFIGEASHLSRGYGSAIVAAFATKLFAEGATRLIIDPDRRNARAIAAYTKAGFARFGTHEGDVLMELHAQQSEFA